MRGPRYIIDIDRFVLTDMALTPAEAERLRVQVADALQRLLQGGWPEDLAGSEIAHVDAPTIHLNDLTGNSPTANDLAQSIIQALQDGGETRGEDRYVRL